MKRESHLPNHTEQRLSPRPHLTLHTLRRVSEKLYLIVFLACFGYETSHRMAFHL
jgi:hypothetical protein